MASRVGALNRLVSLYRSPQVAGDSDGFWEALNPATAWVSIDPQLATGDSDRGITSYVRMRFHPQITIDCKLTYVDPALGRNRDLLVRGVQNTGDRNDEMQLICEEVTP